ncbi:MAG: hypothetical protein JAZ06_07575 [Candidatus Thiodiazotropha taylori]|nr:hypothetical protein [Candidatus Thiodiazotropha taylori]
MVVGFIVFIGLVVYLILSIIVILIGVRYARKKGKSSWKYGLFAAIAMYLVMFWDFIPIHIAHKYYCETEAGFTIYKTIEKWKEENPGVAETLMPNKSVASSITNDRKRYVLNQRFAWDINTTKHFLGIRKNDNRIIDTGTSQILAQYVDFSSGQSSLDPKEFRDFKFWIHTKSCEKDGRKQKRKEFYKFEGRVELLGSGKK